MHYIVSENQWAADSWFWFHRPVAAVTLYRWGGKLLYWRPFPTLIGWRPLPSIQLYTSQKVPLSPPTGTEWRLLMRQQILVGWNSVMRGFVCVQCKLLCMCMFSLSLSLSLTHTHTHTPFLPSLSLPQFPATMMLFLVCHLLPSFLPVLHCQSFSPSCRYRAA